MKVQATADLGGLGASTGTPVAITWLVPNLMPRILPWLAVLLLLALKPNRSAQAWWIWAPLLAWVIFFWTSVDEEENFLLSAATGIGFGMTSLWLLAPFLARWHRGLSFAAAVFFNAMFSLLAFAVNLDWDNNLGVFSEDQKLIWGGWLCIGLVFAIGLTGAGMACARRYSALRVVSGLLLGLLAGWVITAAIAFPLFALYGEEFAWNRAVILVIGGTFFSFCALLPFLILSFATSFYRQRLKNLLHLKTEIPSPPIINFVETQGGQGR